MAELLKIFPKTTLEKNQADFNIWCSYCMKNIKEYRYKCLECHDCDLCSICYEKRKCNDGHENNHVVVRFSKPDILFGQEMDESSLNLDAFKKMFKREKHEHTECNSCNKAQIVGVRVKCDVCPDFNMCLDCRKDHNNSHPMVAFGKTASLEIKKSDVEMLEKFGQGAFGHVWKAKFKGKTCASKIIRADKNNMSGNLTSYQILFKSFIREQEAYSEINSENVLKMIGYCSYIEGSVHNYMILTEFMEKGSLEDVLKKELNLTNNRRFSIAADVAAGLARIHKLKIVHRDLRPENILLGANYVAKIANMGLTKLIANNDQYTGKFGPWRYMPPEFKTGSFDHKLDIFSFGLTLNELFGGEHELKEEIQVTKQALVVWSFIEPCIQRAPERRPNAQSLSERLVFLRVCVDNLFNDMTEYFQITHQRRQEIFQTELKSAMSKYDEFKKQERKELEEQANKEKLAYFKKNMDDWESVYPNYESYEPIFAMGLVKDAYFDMNDSDRALEFSQKSLEKCQALYKNQDHLDTSDSLNEIGNVYINLRKEFDEAAKYFRMTLEMRERLFAGDPLHPKLAIAKYNLGNALFEQQKYSEALDMFKSALEAMEKYYGPNSCQLLIVLEKIQDIYSKQKDNVNILRYAKECLRIRRLYFRLKYPNRIFGSYFLVRGEDDGKPAWHYVFIEDDDKYLDLQAHKTGTKMNVLDYGKIVASGWGRDPPESLTEDCDTDFSPEEELNISGLPKTCSDDEDPVFKMLYSGLKTHHEMFKERANIYSIRYLKELHYYFYDMNDAYNCKLYTSKLLEMCQDLFGNEDNVYKSDAFYCMARCCEMKEDLAGMLEYGKKAFEMRQRLLPANDPKLAESNWLMGDYYKKKDEPSYALPFYKQLLEMCKYYNGPESKTVAMALGEIWECYEKLNDMQNCLKYRNESLRVKKALYKKKNPDGEYFDIFLLKGKDQGRPAWHYVLIEDEAKYQKLRRLKSGTTIDVSELGRIIESGSGLNPSKKILKDIEEKYGV